MDSNFISIIAVNLGILLVVSWVLGILIFVRQEKDKAEMQAMLDKALQGRAQKTPAAPDSGPEPTSDPIDFPLEPVEIEDENALNLLNTLDTINNNLLEKEQRLSSLSELQSRQKALLEEEHSSPVIDALMANHVEAQETIDGLELQIKGSQQLIENLENKLRESRDKDSRIAILEETEKRLRGRVNSLNKNQAQTKVLAAGLRKANDKNEVLRSENNKLKKNIQTMAMASQEQLETIRKINTQLDKAKKLEKHQRKVIYDLENQLAEKRRQKGDSAQVQELEQELQDANSKLERTLREKTFIESHLIEMDQALEKAKETEAALEQARKEIETLEAYFPEFAQNQPHEPLPQIAIDSGKQPKLRHFVDDNRLFGLLQDLWSTLDMPPLKLQAENNVARPKTLTCWTKTSIANDTYSLYIGTNHEIKDKLAQAMAESDQHDLKDRKAALTELGNVISTALLDELDEKYTAAPSEQLDEKTAENQFNDIAATTEVLLHASDHPLYLVLAKPR